MEKLPASACRPRHPHRANRGHDLHGAALLPCHHAGPYAGATSAAPFSEIGYFFGQEILNTLNVPVGLINNGLPPDSFEIAGADHTFQPANAALAGQTITVTRSVATPVKIRYSGQPFSMGNVMNAAPLPLSPFQLNIAP